MYQQDIFTNDRKHCPHCLKLLPQSFWPEEKKAYGYELTKDLVKIAQIIWEWCYKNKHNKFLTKEVSQDHKFLTQFQKLQYFGIIEKVKKSMYWKFTIDGYLFLKGNVALPSKVWVRKNKVSVTEDELVEINQVYPNWKTQSQMWIKDYLLLPYNKVFV